LGSVKRLIAFLLGGKVAGTRVTPVHTKILITFILIILVSNLSSNYINLTLNRAEMVRQMKELLAKDLRDIYNFCNNQYEIFELTGNKARSIGSITRKSLHELKNDKAVVLGVRPDGKLLFQASKVEKQERFSDQKSLLSMKASHVDGQQDGFLKMRFLDQKYLAAWKYNSKWNIFLVRAEEENDFFRRQRAIFRNVSIIILVITLISTAIGIWLLQQILRYVRVITRGIMEMVRTQELSAIDLSRAPADDITYLGMAFNSLSSTVNNLIGIFRKFANQDIVHKAYHDREVKLEGIQRELTILFTDIKRFTFITETLGTDIIKLLNLHYDHAIREIIRHDGVIGSIIGDALLAVFGVLETSTEHGEGNKSYQAVLAGYKQHETVEKLRLEMKEKRDALVERYGKLTVEEEKVYKAVQLEVGVGIDGGEVFYGTLGSYVRMTNTVIGDNVNAASRLEGLTRVYKVPVICSEYVKNDIEKNVAEHGLKFVELDRVQVKGKTKGISIYWPVLGADYEELQDQLEIYSVALKFYYKGDWKQARPLFKKCKLAPAAEFRKRISGKLPEGWKGIWAMTSK
jgi:adenylate cyclase